MSEIRLEAPELGRDVATNGPSFAKPRVTLIPKKDKKSPANTSYAYDVMSPRWAKINDLLGGTETMRAASQRYLPQHPGESDRNYENRLAVATLFNMTEMTLDAWVGKPFGETPKKSDDMPENIKLLLEDVDLQGNNIDVFARNWFRNGLAKSLSHVMVDFPRRAPKEDGTPYTLEDDRKERVRPYLVHIQPENLIFAHAEMVQGKEVFTHIRILECETVRDGFGEGIVRRIKVFEIGKVTVYEEQKVKGKKVQWVQVDTYNYDLPYIPLITFYANREDFMVGKPPLTDLGDLNIAHWQSTSDQRNCLTVARFPILALSGSVPEDTKMTIGPNTWLYSADAQAKYYYVEHQGAALNAGSTDIRALEEQMAAYGAEYLKKKPGRQTATAATIDNNASTSPLQDATKRFQDCLNLALNYLGNWLKNPEDKNGTIEINMDFGSDELNTVDLAALQNARKNRDISRPAYLDELKRRGVLKEDFDVDADEALIEAEVTAFLAMSSVDLDPAAPPPTPKDPASSGNG